MADEKKRDDYTINIGDRSRPVSPRAPPKMAPSSSTSVAQNPILPILAYCGSSILMTVTNKYVLSGLDFNLNFFLLCVQVRCVGLHVRFAS